MSSRCLDIPVILLQIFELVFASKNGYPDLAGLARTCRSFNEPALTILWYNQPSLLPLVLCFPRDVLELEQSRDSAQQVVRFTHPPSTQDWERPFQYAKYIKTMRREKYHWFLHGYQLHPSVLQILLDSCPTFPILPRLRDLEYASICGQPGGSISDITYMDALVKFSRPTALQSLSFLFPTNPSVDVARRHLTMVMESCENIECLDVQWQNSDLSLPMSDYFVAFASLQKLQRFSVHSNTNSTIDSRTQATDISFPASFTMLPSSFPSLVKLDLHHFSKSAVIDILTAVRSRSLQEINLNFIFVRVPDVDGEKLILTLATHLPWQESMRSVIVEGMTVSASGLHHLMLLRNLRHITIRSEALDDEKVDAMAKAWPSLEELTVTCRSPSPESGSVTLESLVFLRTQCPYLRHLELRLDASKIPSLQGFPQFSSSHRRDVTLHREAQKLLCPEAPSQSSRSERPPLFLGIDASSTIRNSVGVADFLMTLFPRIQVALRFFIGSRHTYGTETLWARVASLINERLEQAPQPVPPFTTYEIAQISPA